MLAQPTSERQFLMYEALRKGADVQTLHEQDAHQALVHRTDEGTGRGGGRDPPLPGPAVAGRVAGAGQEGRLLRPLPGAAAGRRRTGNPPAAANAGRWCRASTRCHVSGVENAAYYYSSYNAPDATTVSDRRKVMVLGGGPNRIGQGIEFDYCCVHAAFALRDEGLESIMVNCNPETVSTDYDTSNKLYFEPLTVEDILAIYEKEKPEGVIVQFGGQTPLNIAAELAAAGVRILGTSPGCHRSGRGPGPLPPDDAQAGHPGAGIGHGQHAGRGPGHRAPRSATR